MRLSRCSRPSGPLERAPLTALWASVARLADHADRPLIVASAAPAGAVTGRPAGAACDAWWTADERYVLRVAGGAEDLWYVGELDAADAGAAPAAALPADREGDRAVAFGVAPRPPRDGVPPGSRSMLVGRRRGPRSASGAMRLHVRRPPRV